MAFNISEFRSALKYGGARTSHFKVRLTNPITTAADREFEFMCKATSLPGWNLQPIEQFYFGRSMKLAGNRQFEDWTVQVINDEDFAIRNALETWSNQINGLISNVNKTGTSDPAAYKSVGTVIQYSKNGEVLRTYKFSGLWPMQIAPIDLSWESEQIQEFAVTFSVDWFEVDETATGTGGGT